MILKSNLLISLPILILAVFIFEAPVYSAEGDNLGNAPNTFNTRGEYIGYLSNISARGSVLSEPSDKRPNNLYFASIEQESGDFLILAYAPVLIGIENKIVKVDEFIYKKDSEGIYQARLEDDLIVYCAGASGKSVFTKRINADTRRAISSKGDYKALKTESVKEFEKYRKN